jgi:hypothetical protein
VEIVRLFLVYEAKGVISSSRLSEVVAAQILVEAEEFHVAV